ncbi:MAG: stage III sporulation protein AB [Bacillota bacterium]|nr:stage III sporulation protein AB [Bacillota bacterium]
MIRLLGAALIMGACLWFGAYFALREKYRLEELEELERGLIYLQGQIGYLSAPLSAALEGVGWRMNGRLGSILRQAAEALSERQGESAEEIWRRVWQEAAGKTFLTAEDEKNILAFGHSLGYLDRGQQEKSIALLLRTIEGELSRGRERLRKNGRLYYGMGTLSGLLLVVTLL